MDVTLHPSQLEVFNAVVRYKVVAAGRRFGKSFLAAVTLFVEASKNTKVRTDGVEVDLALEEVYYIAPTFEQGKKILWPLLKELGADLIATKYENTGTLTLVNGRRISIKGADRPDSLRGVGLSYVVLDEYAFMKEEVWEMIVSPALARSEGGALFIGTPDGKNHFYTVYKYGLSDQYPKWASWHFKSIQNPYLPIEEIEEAEQRMSRERFRQEMEAEFETGGGLLMTADMFPIIEQAPAGMCYIACDLAGFQKVEGGRKLKRLDEHAIAVAVVHEGGWAVKEIVHGHWDTRECALQMVRAFRKHRPMAFGIEKGMAMNAVLPYLQDEMARLGTWFEVEPLTHGNQKKTDRITWALQGRAEKGRIQLVEGEWNKPFIEQACDFPSTVSHDDLIDALAYIDQIADPYFGDMDVIDEWQPLDEDAAY